MAHTLGKGWLSEGLVDDSLNFTSISSRAGSHSDLNVMHFDARYQMAQRSHSNSFLSAVSRRKDGALRYTPVFRPPIMNRPEFFFRYGPQERAALATFDFLDRLPTAATSDATASRR